MSEARKTALRALAEVWGRGRMPKAVLEGLSGGMEARDRAFVMEMVYGVLRNRDLLDWTMGRYLRRPGGLALDTRNNLRLGAYQIFFLRVPQWAAVNEAVEMEGRRPGLVNGVLRNLTRNREGIEAEMDRMRQDVLDPSAGGALRRSLVCTLTSHPAWLIRRWTKRLGLKEAYDLALSNNRVPPLTLRVNTLRADRDEVLRRLLAMGVQGEATSFSPDGIKLEGRRSFRELLGPGGLEGGVVFAQDEAAQLVTYMLGPRPGERVLDACAAPGGKTTHIVQLMEDAGEVVAVEEDERRMTALRENLAAMGAASVRVMNADVSALRGPLAPPPFDRALLDAPCSSLGVIRRNPDIKYRRAEADLARFGERQLGLLRAVAAMVRPGGRLVYATCSTEPEEGEEVVGEFLKSSRDFFMIRDGLFSSPGLGGLGGTLAEGGFLRTYPHRHDMDGFFGAAIGRKD
jgi:16S rRNA (cytosine967-C5)-methyltransferase